MPPTEVRDYRKFEMASWSAEVKAKAALDPDRAYFWTTVAQACQIAAKVTRDAAHPQEAAPQEAQAPQAHSPDQAERSQAGA
jgi:hypothetical protein